MEHPSTNYIRQKKKKQTCFSLLGLNVGYCGANIGQESDCKAASSNSTNKIIIDK